MRYDVTCALFEHVFVGDIPAEVWTLIPCCSLTANQPQPEAQRRSVIGQGTSSYRCHYTVEWRRRHNAMHWRERTYCHGETGQGQSCEQ